jgi:hypothetical protein
MSESKEGLTLLERELIGLTMESAIDQLAIVGGTLRAGCMQLQRQRMNGRPRQDASAASAESVVGDVEPHTDETDEPLESILLRWNKIYQVKNPLIYGNEFHCAIEETN